MPAAFLIVQVDKVCIPLEQETVSLKEGQSFHLQCSYRPANDSSVNVEWTRDGAPIPESSRLKTVSDFGFSRLDVIRADSRDSGTYQCRVFNRYLQKSRT